MSPYRGGEWLSSGGPAVVAVAAGLGLGIAAAGSALFGPAALGTVLPAALLGTLILVLTALSALELMGGSADPSGGTHVLVYEVTEGIVGFLSGWFLLAGGVTLAAMLARAAGEQAAAALSLWVAVPPTAAAVVVLLAVALLRVAPDEARSQWRRLAAGVLTVGLGALALSNGQASSPLVQPSVTGLAGWLALGYAPLEVALTAYRWRGDHRARVRAVGSALAFSIVGGAVLLMRGGSSGLAPVAHGLFLAAILLGLDGALRIATHALSTLVRLGAVPASLGRSVALGKVPVALLLAMLAPLALLALPGHWVRGVALLAWLLTALALNAAAVHSHRVEPDRRRPFRVPFYPAGPTLAMLLSSVLLLGLPSAAWVGGAIWLAAGGVVYLVYARRNQVNAEEGSSRFTGKGLPAKPEKGYRVLLPLRSGSGYEKQHAFPLALALAEAGNGDVLLLRVIVAADPLAEEEERRRAQEEDQRFRWTTEAGEAAENVHAITRMARSRAEGILDTAVEADCDVILLASEVRRQRERLGRVIDPVARSAPRDVALLLLPSTQPADEEPIKRVLLPTRGGPQLPLAARLALSLVRGEGALVRVLHVVEGHASADEMAEAEALVDRAVVSLQERAEAQERADVTIEGKVLRGGSPAAAIAKQSAGFDLVVMGATGQGVLDRVLFGTVPEEVAHLSSVPVLLGRAYRGLPRFWLRRLWDGLFGAVPKLNAEEQVEVYQGVRRSARPRPDFFIMIGLATLIAAFGLQQDNPAVIIGAMLVAPLFSPVIALSLGVARGDGRLLRVSAETALKGILLAVGLALLVGELIPMPHITREMTSRTQPGLLDLGVALAAGAAGAYAMSRTRLSASLPGVAIAASLVPPLAVVGMGLAWRSWETAWGASLLFGTNLVAITLAGALVFLLVGYRPAPRKEEQERLRLGLLLMIAGVVLVSAPLAVISSRSIGELRAQRTVEEALREHLSDRPDTRLVDVELERVKGEYRLTATIAAVDGITVAEVTALEGSLEEAVGRPVNLQLVVWPVITAGDG